MALNSVIFLPFKTLDLLLHLKTKAESSFPQISMCKTNKKNRLATFDRNQPASSQIRDCMAELKSATEKEVYFTTNDASLSPDSQPFCHQIISNGDMQWINSHPSLTDFEWRHKY